MGLQIIPVALFVGMGFATIGKRMSLSRFVRGTAAVTGYAAMWKGILGGISFPAFSNGMGTRPHTARWTAAVTGCARITSAKRACAPMIVGRGS